MKMITVPTLRMAQLQSLSEKAISITENLPEVAPQVAESKALYETFKDGMTREEASSDKRTLDRTRDNLNSGYFKAVECEQSFPHESAVVQVLDRVVKITENYGFGLNRMTYDEQTAQTDNMLKELEALDLSALPSLSRWLAPIKDANDNFKKVADEYFQGLNASAETTAASKAALPLTEALNNLFTLLFAHAKVSGSAELTSAYKELITLVGTYK